MNDMELSPREGILQHPEGVDLLPANIELSGLEVSLVKERLGRIDSYSRRW
jgi:chromosome partitioning protein